MRNEGVEVVPIKLEVFAADYRIPESSSTQQWVKAFSRDSVTIEAVVVAGDQVLAACAPAAVDTTGPGGWEVWTLAKDSGARLGSCAVAGSRGPRFDGMAVANEQVYVSTNDGAVVCLR